MDTNILIFAIRLYKSLQLLHISPLFFSISKQNTMLSDQAKTISCPNKIPFFFNLLFLSWI